MRSQSIVRPASDIQTIKDLPMYSQKLVLLVFSLPQVMSTTQIPTLAAAIAAALHRAL